MFSRVHDTSDKVLDTSDEDG